MFQEDRTKQPELFAFSHRDLVEESSDVWLYIDLFEALDLRAFESGYVEHGQAGKHPRLMLQALFYGLTHGVVSGRKLCDACRNDNRFIVLSGNLRPDRRTLDRFVRRHEKLFSTLFVQVVRLAQVMGLVRLGRVAVDGSKFKAQTNSSMRYGDMDRALKEIEDQLKQLKIDLARENRRSSSSSDELEKAFQDQERRRDQIKRAKQIIEEDFAKRGKNRPGRKEKSHRALSDPEALPVSPKKGFYFGYNVQAAVDEEHQIVVANDVEDKQTDYMALPKLVDQVEKNCGSQAHEYLADAGYMSLPNIQKIQEVGANPYIARKTKKALQEKEINDQVRKGSHDREYLCMDGRVLDLASRNSNGRLDFRMSKTFCDGCKLTSRCEFYGKRRPELLDDADRDLYTTYLKHSRTNAFAKVLSRRKVIVEPVFGNIKNKGMRILCRGKPKVKCWWNIATTAHNIEKIIKAMLLQTAIA